MTAFDTAWQLCKSDPHTWIPNSLRVGRTDIPSGYECIICGAERHGVQERDPSGEGMKSAIERFGHFYDNQGHIKRHGLDLGWSVPMLNSPVQHHYTNPTKPICDGSTLHESPLMVHRKRLDDYLNPKQIHLDDLPPITDIQYSKSPSQRSPDAYVAFVATTPVGNIRNDGMGGATYFEPTSPEGMKFRQTNEFHWDKHITNYEHGQDFSSLGEDYE
jgi:hypothetical protein